jgi:hypothetical protein
MRRRNNPCPCINDRLIAFPSEAAGKHFHAYILRIPIVDMDLAVYVVILLRATKSGRLIKTSEQRPDQRPRVSTNNMQDRSHSKLLSSSPLMSFSKRHRHAWPWRSPPVLAGAEIGILSDSCREGDYSDPIDFTVHPLSSKLHKRAVSSVRGLLTRRDHW